MTDMTKEELLAEQHDRPGQLEEESNAWWAMFIEHWAELADGDVVDVQFILSETSSPKVSERIKPFVPRID